MQKRFISLGLALCFLLTTAAARILYVSLNNAYNVSDSYNSYSLSVEKKYTQILDCNNEPLTNYQKEYVAVIKPNEKCLSELPKLFDRAQIKEITDTLSQGYPLIMPVEQYVDTKYIQILNRTVQNSSNMTCRQLLDSACSGLEMYTNDIVSETKINFAVDARGRVLTGDSAQIITEEGNAPKAVKITIDKNIQKKAELAAKSLEKGVVVVLDAQTGELRASVSKPADYNNRVFSPYCLGSVFKLIVAACALENKLNPQYECKGKITVGDTTYSCQKEHVHGKQTLKEALANSCNCYFVNLALMLGEDKLRNMAEDFGFGNASVLYDGWRVSNGNLPSASVLQSSGQLALLGFGQGSLTDTPYHFALCMAAIANGGIYKTPALTGEPTTQEKRVLTDENAKKLLTYMRGVVAEGTGQAADYQQRSAGKTATAQSGQYENGREILHTYFAGVYPYDSPKYVIVVMNEDGSSGAEDCCPVFRTLVEMLSIS